MFCFFQLNVQHIQNHDVWPNVNPPADCLKNSVQILHVPVNVSVQTLFTLIVKGNVRKKERSQYWVPEISLVVHSANAPVHPTTTIPVRPSALRKEKFTLNEPKTDTVVIFASVDAWTETVIQNAEIWTSESSRPVSASAQMTVNQIATVASRRVTNYKCSSWK